MKLSDVLVDDWIAVPMEARDLAGALRDLVGRLERSGVVEGERAAKLARDLAFGSGGEVVRVNDDVVLVLGQAETLEDLSITLGVASEPFAVSGEGREPPGTARAVLLALTPRSVQSLRTQIVPTLVRVLRDEERTLRLLAAGSSVEIRGMKELMEAELHDRLLVEDVLSPLKYRVYPDTPLREVVDLMVRRGLRAVPVVGERYELLGMLTSGDVLRHLLPRKRGEEQPDPGKGGLAAREVMTRSVMCVSEDQTLMEAANMLINRDVEQLPVVREGELVGFVSRDAILRTLFGGQAEG